MFRSELNILGDIFLVDILQMERSHSDLERGCGVLAEHHRLHCGPGARIRNGNNYCGGMSTVRCW